MGLEFWNTAASVGTFLVIVVTAVAAMIQLRHLRVNNQLQALFAVMHTPFDPGFSDSFDFVVSKLRDRLQDPAFCDELRSPLPPDRSVHKELNVCDYYDRIGSSIKFGLITEDLYFDNSSPDNFWKVLEPAIALYRETRGPTAYENFEYLVIRSRAWDDRHRGGSLPRGTRRLTLRRPASIDAPCDPEPLERT